VSENKHISLVERTPEVTIKELLAQLVPPREFSHASFENYRPDVKFPSQSAAVKASKKFLYPVQKTRIFGKKEIAKAGLYLDGGFGVGKTHLLAAMYHAFKGRKAFGSFLAYTDLIGVLGFANAVQELSKYDFICIDEFELDDPGDTMMMSRLLSELQLKNVRFAATSNTPPNALGEGRFAAADFAREISAMADRFEIMAIDGEDYRHRPSESHTSALSETELAAWISNHSSDGLAVNNYSELLKHLSRLHPSRYVNLLRGVRAVALTDVVVLKDQVEALRWVAFVDRLYENQIVIRCTGVALTEVFSAEMIAGAYKKKYLRAVSRSGALTSQ
jgi:cell division protein ZapE